MRPESKTTVYEGRRLSVIRERWGTREREIVEAPDVVAVVAVDREGLVTLVRQLREAARRPLLELPAGIVEGRRAARDRQEGARRGDRLARWPLARRSELVVDARLLPRARAPLHR